MSLDPRSRERLAALGRSLPQKLPNPQKPNPTAEPGPRSGRHRLETEQDPEALFRELIAASSDGSVPSHLLDRLRELEGRQSAQPRGQASQGEAEEARSPRGTSAPNRLTGSGAGPAGQQPRMSRSSQAKAPRRPRLDPEQQALYTTFADLLHDEDSDI